VTAGVKEPSNFAVILEDALNNPVTTDHSKVTLEIQSGPAGAAIVGTSTVPVSNGYATFNNVEFPVAGMYTLKAVDGALNVLSTSFNVSAAAAKKLVFLQQPTLTLLSLPISPAITVKVEDQFGNVVTTDTSTVVLSIKSGPKGASLGGMISEAAVAGVATFADVVPSIAGTYVLNAADGHLTSVLSSGFLVA
jgi:hypothetical protein